MFLGGIYFVDVNRPGKPNGRNQESNRWERNPVSEALVERMVRNWNHCLLCVSHCDLGCGFEELPGVSILRVLGDGLG